MNPMKDELDEGYKHAVALVDHLEQMGGAAACVISVMDRAEEYVVSVQPKQGHETQQQMKEALLEAIKLLAHYAELLNQYDGGKRVIFKTPEAWIARLKE